MPAAGSCAASAQAALRCAELIFYRRANERGPKESFHVRSPAADADTLCECLTLAHGQVGRVRKQRTVFLVGRTRVHLDRVEGPEHFLELEVVLAEGEPAEPGIAEAIELMRRLGVPHDHLLDAACVDLLARSSALAANPQWPHESHGESPWR